MAYIRQSLKSLHAARKEPNASNPSFVPSTKWRPRQGRTPFPMLTSQTRTRFVRAEDVHSRHFLHSRHARHDGALLGQLGRSESQCDTQHRRHGNGHSAHHNDQHVCERWAPACRLPNFEHLPRVSSCCRLCYILLLLLEMPLCKEPLSTQQPVTSFSQA